MSLGAALVSLLRSSRVPKAIRHSRLRSLRWVPWTVLVVAIVLVGARLAMPYAIRHYLNLVLAKNATYDGTIGEVDVSLYRGAYTVHEVNVKRRGAHSPVPFASVPTVDLSIEWGALFHRKLVGKVEFDAPELNFVGGSPEQRQTGTGGDWWTLVGKLFPVGLNRVEVRDGKIHFRNFQSHPPVNVRMDHVDLVVENVQNSRHSSDAKHASIDLRGVLPGSGQLVMRAAVDPAAKTPEFDCDVVLRNISLPDLNDFLHAYTKLDASQGRVDLYAEVTARDGSFDGYAKPFLRDISVVGTNEKTTQQSVFSAAWRTFAQGLIAFEGRIGQLTGGGDRLRSVLDQPRRVRLRAHRRARRILQDRRAAELRRAGGVERERLGDRVQLASRLQVTLLQSSRRRPRTSAETTPACGHGSCSLLFRP